MKTKRLLAIFLLAAMTAGVSACGNAADSTSGETSAAASGSASAVETSETETADPGYSFAVKKTDYKGEKLSIITGEHCAYEYRWRMCLQ